MNKKILTLSIIIIGVIIISLFSLPHIFLKQGNITILLNQQYIEPGYKAYYLMQNAYNKVTITNDIDNTKIGNYKVIYKLKNKEQIRTVTVREDEAPVITLSGNDQTYVCPGTKYSEEGYKAIDNYDGDITANVKTTYNDYKVTYKAIDQCNNVTSKVRTLIYEDKDAPSLCLKNGNIYLYVGKTYNEPGYEANDNCLGNITDKVIITGEVDTNKVGKYTLTYTVSDGYQETTKTRDIFVNNNTVSSGNGVVYLTFDDGPNASYTGYILDVLKKYNAHATFFIVPKGSTTDYLIKRENDEGHTVAIHSYSHVYQTVYASDEALLTDISKVNEKIHQVIGKYSYIYRYPGGSSNTVSRNYSKGIISRTSVTLHNMGFHYFDWNISSGDAASHTPSSSAIASNVINSLSKSRINVVLMHDIKRNTAYAVETILDYGTKNGYRFEAITLDTPEVHHSISN